MIDRKHTEQELRDAWKALREWQGPWQPEHFGDMAALIKGIRLDVKVVRWMEPDGTSMAKAMSEGIELERKVLGSSEYH